MNRIKEVRNKLGLSLYKLSEITGLTPSYISNLENGNRANPSLDAMQKISSALGEKVEKVFYVNEKVDKEVS